MNANMIRRVNLNLNLNFTRVPEDVWSKFILPCLCSSDIQHMQFTCRTMLNFLEPFNHRKHFISASEFEASWLRMENETSAYIPTHKFSYESAHDAIHERWEDESKCETDARSEDTQSTSTSTAKSTSKSKSKPEMIHEVSAVQACAQCHHKLPDDVLLLFNLYLKELTSQPLRPSSFRPEKDHNCSLGRMARVAHASRYIDTFFLRKAELIEYYLSETHKRTTMCCSTKCGDRLIKKLMPEQDQDKHQDKHKQQDEAVLIKRSKIHKQVKDTRRDQFIVRTKNKVYASKNVKLCLESIANFFVYSMSFSVISQPSSSQKEKEKEHKNQNQNTSSAQIIADSEVHSSKFFDCDSEWNGPLKLVFEEMFVIPVEDRVAATIVRIIKSSGPISGHYALGKTWLRKNDIYEYAKDYFELFTNSQLAPFYSNVPVKYTSYTVYQHRNNKWFFKSFIDPTADYASVILDSGDFFDRELLSSHFYGLYYF